MFTRFRTLLYAVALAALAFSAAASPPITWPGGEEDLTLPVLAGGLPVGVTVVHAR